MGNKKKHPKTEKTKQGEGAPLSDARFLNESFFWADSQKITGRAGSQIELNRSLVPGWWRRTHSGSSTSNSKRTEWAGSTNCRSLPRITEDSTKTEWAMAKFADHYRRFWWVCWRYCKPEAHTGNMLIMTVINLHFIKTCKTFLSSDVNNFTIVCVCILYLKLLKRNQGVYKTGLFILYTVEHIHVCASMSIIMCAVGVKLLGILSKL